MEKGERDILTSEKTIQRILKALIAISFILISFASFIIAWNYPATSYELSVYSSLPLAWIFMILAIVIGIITLVYQALNRNYRYFQLSFLILILGNFIILSLPYFKGYFLYGGSDPFAHLQMTSFVISNGRIQEDNFYPILHILGAILTEVLSIRIETVMKLLPVAFTILFMIFTYFLATAVSPKKEYGMLAFAASATLLFTYFHVTAYPFCISLFLFPFVFYLYFKSRESKLTRTSYIVLLIISLLLMPYTHALPSAALIFCLLAAEVIGAVYTKRAKRESMLNAVNLNPALISGIIWFMWWSSFSIFKTGVKQVNNWLFSEAEKVPRTSELEPVFDMKIEEWIKLIIKTYGDQIIYLILSLIALGLIFKAFLRKKEDIGNLFSLSFIFLASIFSHIILFASIGYTTFGRFLGANIGVWATPILTAFFLFEVLKRYKKIGMALVASILIGSFTLSAFSVYPSPWTLRPNWQFMYQDASGFYWSGEHVHEVGKGYGKAFIGTLIGHIHYGTWGWDVEKIPPHFGYDNHTMLGESLSKDTIIHFGEERERSAIKDSRLKKSPIAGPVALPDINEEDLERLKSDESVNILYTTGGYKILLVNVVSENK